MNGILDVIALNTSGKSFKTHKKVYEENRTPSIEYDDNPNITWKTYGETIHHTKPINLTQLSKELADSNPPLFKFFIDGSRRTFKVDDMSYNSQVFPVIAGQVGVGCCKRLNKQLSQQDHRHENVIALPRIADKDGWESEVFFNRLLKEINSLSSVKKHGISFSSILIYDSAREEESRLEDKGIAKIHDHMINMEKELVADLVKANLLTYESYLVKDGSLEYKQMKAGDYKDLALIRNNYRFVVGVSKTFNPERCLDHSGRNNSSAIANLRLFHRTPTMMYESPMVNSQESKVYFAVWYVRIRSQKYTNSPYDGLLKIEKILTTESEAEQGLESDTVDHITANIINERNPVCWGRDARWANHLYPVYLTERYVKSLFIGSNYFLNMF